MMISKEELKSYFRETKDTKDGGFDCLCNCHNDHNPSFHWKMGNKGWIGKCLACQAKGADAARVAGINVYDLFADSKPRTEYRMSSQQYGYEKNCIDKYPYFRIDSELLTHIKYRMPNHKDGRKNMPQGYDKDGKWVRGTSDIDTSLSLFCNVSVSKLKETAKNNKIVGYFEGEKDCKTGGKYGLIGFTLGGTNNWESRKGVFKYLNNTTLVIFGDNDTDGIRSANEIASYYKQLGGNAVVIIPPNVPEHGDITDYMQDHTQDDFNILIDEALKNNVTNDQNECVVKCDVPTKDVKSLEKVLRDLHAEQYETSDKGFGRLFATVFKDKHRYNPSRKDFMMYDGKRWVNDTEGLSARSSAKDLSDALVRYAVNIDTEGKYLKAVAPLCNIRNRNNMLQDSRDIFFFTNEELDKDDYLLNLQNGTLDLSGDEPRFIEHNPDLLLSKICNVEYEPTATCEEWSKFLIEIMQGDANKIKYLQKIAGLSLTGSTQEETCFILYGSTTRNGKSTYCETLIYLLGDYAITMRPESLAVKQNLDSRQANGDIARLAGCRFCNASEPPKRMLFDTALLKSLLGRDSITARHLHEREFSFIPKFKLVINTNYLPTITDDTVFSSGRINVVSFDRHFEPWEQDKHLKNKLRDKNELSGILNWCIEGLKLYRHEGLEPPQSVKAATESYRSDSDKIGNFIKECLVKTGNNSKAKDIYDKYTEWCDDNGYGCENKGNFFAEMKNKGLFAAIGTVNGKTAKNIVKGYTIETDFVETNSSPFN